MNDGSQFIDIIIFAMIAVFLGLRLRSVLGRRTGEEPPPPAGDPTFGNGANPAGNGSTARTDTVVQLAQRRRPVVSQAEAPLAVGLSLIAAADASFSAEHFLSGAARAFEMIVQAFAAGDVNTLNPLLSPEVFENFQQAIRSRQEAGETCFSKLEEIVTTELIEATIVGGQARITVRFVSRQLILIKNASDQVVEGNPDRAVQITDLWTFARVLRSSNPNWLLVATSSQDE